MAVARVLGLLALTSSGARSPPSPAICWPGCRCSPEPAALAGGNRSGSACGSLPSPEDSSPVAAACGSASPDDGPGPPTSPPALDSDTELSNYALSNLTARRREGEVVRLKAVLLRPGTGETDMPVVQRNTRCRFPRDGTAALVWGNLFGEAGGRIAERMTPMLYKTGHNDSMKARLADARTRTPAWPGTSASGLRPHWP